MVLGGYGWAEHLTPVAATTLADQPDGEPGPLLPAVDDPGYLHAPSLHQAQVAALLRNAHLANGGGEDDPFAISLTSERVRLARWIFDGVRAGRTVGAVLGYLVERDLHDHGLDACIDNAREVAPVPGEEDLPPAARRLDGLRLHKLWADSEDHALDHLVGDDPSDTTRDRARAVLRRLGVAVDAAADAMQAEQVHQFTRGDLTRAVSSLADFDRGLVPPPDLEFLQTPRTGAGVTHRVGIVIDPNASRPAGWAGPDTSPRAAAEPALDTWLARQLGTATGRTLTVRDGAAGQPTAVDLSDLHLAASDFVRLAGAGEQGASELAAWAALASGSNLVRPTLVPDRDLLDLLEVGGSLAVLVGGAKPLDGVGMQPPHADPEPGIDVDEMQHRVPPARDAVARARSALQAALADPAQVDQVGAAVAATWPLGVGDAAVPVETTPEGWAGAAARSLVQLQARLTEADALDDPAAKLRALLGPGFVALPRFIATTAPDLVASRDDPALTGDDPLAAEVWLTRMERVREPLRRMTIALREAEAFGGPAFTVGAAQVPHRAGAVWNALKAPEYVDGAASLLLYGAELVAPGRVLSGLLADEWSEVIPSAEETTGLAFRYDPPDLMAPQAILLAVPPVVGEPWSLAPSTRCSSRPLSRRTCAPSRRRRWAPCGSTCQPPCSPSTPKVTRSPPTRTPSPRRRADMASITTFFRLEPEPLASDVTAGATAPVQDALWLLARQWQLGEFAGQDGGTPVVARWRGVAAQPTRFVAGPIPPNTRQQAPRFDAMAAPLETLIERAGLPLPSVATSAEGLRLGVDTGRLFLRVLGQQTTSRDYGPDVLQAFPVPEPDAEELASLDPATAGYARLHAGRSLDGDGCAPSSPDGTCRGSASTSTRATARRCGPRRPTGCVWSPSCLRTPTRWRRAGSRPGSSTPPRCRGGARPTPSTRPPSPLTATTATPSTGTSSTSTAR